MKKLFFLLLIIPLSINAKLMNYSDSIKETNNYMGRTEYSTKDKYLIVKDLLFEYDGTLKSNSSFIKAGMLNKYEYELSTINGKSYLSPGIEYWLMTKYNISSNYYVDINLKHKELTNLSNVRVTQFVKKETKVTGSGSYSEPWEFTKSNIVQIKSNNTNYGYVGKNDSDRLEGISEVLDESIKKYSFKLFTNFGYDFNGGQGCNITHVSNNNYELNNINNDIVCLVVFGPKKYKYNLVGNYTTNPSPTDIYLLYKKGWYSDSNAKTSINKITIPIKLGYLFKGYYTENNGSGTKVIDEDGKILNGTYEINQNDNYDQSLYSYFIENTFKVTLDNQGATTAGTSIIYQKYNKGWYSDSNASTSILSITIPKKTGYTFGGYYTKTNGAGTKVIDLNGSILSSKTTTFTEDGTLYAQWLQCEAGTYISSNTTSTVCAQCPSGYRDGAVATKESECKRNIPGGYYMAVSKGTSNTACPVKTAKSAHTINYGDTSSCNACSGGYYAASGASSCTQCPAGYRDGPVGTKQYDCYANVAADYIINTAGSSTKTRCSADGYTSDAAIVHYGDTTSCRTTYEIIYYEVSDCASSIKAQTKVTDAWSGHPKGEVNNWQLAAGSTKNGISLTKAIYRETYDKDGNLTRANKEYTAYLEYAQSYSLGLINYHNDQYVYLNIKSTKKVVSDKEWKCTGGNCVSTYYSQNKSFSKNTEKICHGKDVDCVAVMKLNCTDK